MLERFRKCLSLENHYKHVENDATYAVERKGDKLSLYFEWSNGKKDWLSNIDFPAKPYRNMENLWFCHRGFLKVWKSIEPYIAEDIMDMTVKEIEIVGYSHGAAIAQLCYEYVKFNRPYTTVTGIGYGSPRVLWGFANKTVKSRFEGFVVVRNGNDIVTHLPPVVFGFRHMGEVLNIGESVGPIKDHYPERYIDGLTKYEAERQ
jgi:hypothetical protein